jgi:type I restriction enzyme S subunit
MIASTRATIGENRAWQGAAPENWTLMQLKRAITFQRGYDLPMEDREVGPIPVVTSGGITAWHNVAKAPGPGIVTGRYGTIGVFHLIAQDYWPLNTSLYSIDLHGNDPAFLRYLLEPLAPLFHLITPATKIIT